MVNHFSCLRVLKDARLREFINFALTEGWHVKLTRAGNIQLTRKGYATIYNASYLIEKSQSTGKKQIQYPVEITNVIKRKPKGGCYE